MILEARGQTNNAVTVNFCYESSKVGDTIVDNLFANIALE